MMYYFIRLLQYLKRVEPMLNEERLLYQMGMPIEVVEQVMEEYENANILIQKL